MILTNSEKLESVSNVFKCVYILLCSFQSLNDDTEKDLFLKGSLCWPRFRNRVGHFDETIARVIRLELLKSYQVHVVITCFTKLAPSTACNVASPPPPEPTPTDYVWHDVMQPSHDSLQEVAL